MRPSSAAPERPPPNEPSDAELVARVLGGEREALEILMRRHYRGAYVVALAVLGSTADAEDACHDALVRSAARLEECRQPEKFGAWLRTIVRNHARNLSARRAVRDGPPLDTVAVAVESDAPRAIDRDALRRKLEAGITRLTPPQREVLLQHDLEDRPHEEIAEMLGTSIGMSRQHLFQARRRLRDFLGLATLEEYRDE